MRLGVYQPRPPLDAIRVFPALTAWTPKDDLTFFGDPPALSDRFTALDRSMPVMVSVVFDWHKRRAENIADNWRRHFSDVRVGGPAYGDPGDEFTPGMFLKMGCTITSRGCPKKCGWCSVPKREGAIRELQIKPGWIVQDNNLLACSEPHQRAVFDMLREQGVAVKFNGGLDKHYLRDWHRDLFDSVKVEELWFACDTAADLPQLERAARIMEGWSIEKLRCYTMIGYDHETLDEAARRCARVYEIGFLPFCQLYQPIGGPLRAYDDAWRKVHRTWARPAAYRSKPRPPEAELFAEARR
jgi:hypothetical protein